jgi:hypothetical protein
MTEQLLQWEHCQLVLLGVTIPQRPAAGPDDPSDPVETHYHVQVVYMGPDGTYVERRLATLDQTLDDNPFYRVIGLLGGAGWELVSMEARHDYAWTDDLGKVVVPYHAGWRPVSRTAYFKRPVVAGRGVDEPQLTL